MVQTISKQEPARAKKWLNSQLGFVIAALGLSLAINALALFPISKYCEPQRSEKTKVSSADADKQGNPSAEKSAFVKVVEAIYDAIKAQNQAQGGKKEFQSWWHGFWCEMKVSDFFIATFALWLVLAGAWQGFHLKSTVDQLRKEFAVTHRPRLIVRNILIEKQTFDQPIKVTYRVVNIGGLEAQILLLDAVIWVTQALGPAIARPPHEEGKALEPQQKIDEGCFHTFAAEMPEALRDHWDSIKQTADHWSLYLVGTIGYVSTDSHSSLYFTGFCRKLNKDTWRFEKTNDPDYEYQD